VYGGANIARCQTLSRQIHSQNDAVMFLP